MNSFVTIPLSVCFRNSELLSGVLGKSTLGSGSKQGLFYALIRDNAFELARGGDAPLLAPLRALDNQLWHEHRHRRRHALALPLRHEPAGDAEGLRQVQRVHRGVPAGKTRNKAWHDRRSVPGKRPKRGSESGQRQTGRPLHKHASAHKQSAYYVHLRRKGFEHQPESDDQLCGPADGWRKAYSQRLHRTHFASLLPKHPPPRRKGICEKQLLNWIGGHRILLSHNGRQRGADRYGSQNCRHRLHAAQTDQAARRSCCELRSDH